MLKALKIVETKKAIILQIIALILSMLSNGSVLLIPFLVSKIVDNYSSNSTIDTASLKIILIISFVSVFIDYIHALLISYISELMGQNLKVALMKRLLQTNYSTLMLQERGFLLTIFTDDVNSIRYFMANETVSVTNGVFILLGSLFLMFNINASLTMIIILFIPIFLGIFYLTFKSAGKIFKRSKETLDLINKVINETIKGSMLIRVLNSQKEENNKFFSENKNYKAISLQIVKIFATVIPLIILFSGGTQVITVWLGSHKIIAGDMSIGYLASFISYVSAFTWPLVIIGFIVSSLGNFSVSLRRISEVLDLKNTQKDGNLSLETIKKVRLDNVSLRLSNFPNNTKAEETTDELIEDVSFEINKGDQVGLIGETGAGKSLLIKLVLRLLDPTSGVIRVNGIPLQKYKLGSWLAKIGYVPQEDVILNTSIRENITFGSNPSQKEVENVAETALVSEFAEKLPEKLNTEVSERGQSLSGGQKQRISIARALLKNPQLLILDNSTSKLDVKTEEKLIKNIKMKFPNITILIATQRKSALSICNKVVVLDQGRIETFGTLQEVKEKSFIYSQLF